MYVVSYSAGCQRRVSYFRSCENTCDIACEDFVARCDVTRIQLSWQKNIPARNKLACDMTSVDHIHKLYNTMVPAFSTLLRL